MHRHRYSRGTSARPGADVGRYSFIAVDFHHLRLAGLRRAPDPVCVPHASSILRTMATGVRVWDSPEMLGSNVEVVAHDFLVDACTGDFDIGGSSQTALGNRSPESELPRWPLRRREGIEADLALLRAYAVEPDPPPQDGEVMLQRVAVKAPDKRVEKTVVRRYRVGDLVCVGLCPAFDVSQEEPVEGENLPARAAGSALRRAYSVVATLFVRLIWCMAVFLSRGPAVSRLQG
jgi:hypothetical protein